MKVVLDQDCTAHKILKVAPNLGNDENDEEVKKIKIFRDKNKNDRERRKALVEEMRQKNEDLKQNNVTDSKYIIKGDRTVKVKVNPNQPKRNF